jgi:hypothetical protein
VVVCISDIGGICCMSYLSVIVVGVGFPTGWVGIGLPFFGGVVKGLGVWDRSHK